MTDPVEFDNKKENGVVPTLQERDPNPLEISIEEFERGDPNLSKLLNSIVHQDAMHQDAAHRDVSKHKDKENQDKFTRGGLSIYSDLRALASDQKVTLPQLSDHNLTKILESDLFESLSGFVEDGIARGDIIHQFIGEINHRYPKDFGYIKRKYPQNLYSPETLGALFVFATLKLEEDKDYRQNTNQTSIAQEKSLAYTPLLYNSKEWKSAIVSKIVELFDETSLPIRDQSIILKYLHLRLALIAKHKGNMDKISEIFVKEISKARKTEHGVARHFFDRVVRTKHK